MMQKDSIKKGLFWGILSALFFYLFVMQLYAVWQFNVDDMYITLRYARHLVNGHGIVWNIGSMPLEGYSNFSYLLIAALAMKLGLNPIISLKAVSVFCLFLTVVTLYAMTRLWLKPKFAVIPSLWLLTYRGEIIWTVSGLETAAFQCLILASAFCLFLGLGYEIDNDHRTSLKLNYFIFSGFLLSLAGLTRPDAPAFMLAWFIALVWTLYVRDRHQIQEHRIKAILYYCGVICIAYGSYFLWRWNYFGALFPNSVYCKWLTGVDKGFLNYEYLMLIWPLMVLAIPYLFWIKDARKLFLILPSIIYLILLYDSENLVAFFIRHFLACFVLLLPMGIIGLEYLNTKVKKYMSDSLATLLVYVIATYFAILFLAPMTLYAYDFYIVNMVKGNELRHQMVEWIGKHQGFKSKAVIADCGATGYFSELHIIDSFCLNSSEMTSKAIGNSTQKFVNWVLNKEKPATITITMLKYDGKIFFPPVDEAITNHPSFKQNYMFKRVFRTSQGNGYYQYEVYFKKPTVD
jgi:hypothetical protein